MQRSLVSVGLVTFFLTLTGVVWAQPSVHSQDKHVYSVRKLNGPLVIDANWNKPQWKKTKAVDINNFIIRGPIKFHPSAQAKMMYDDQNIYVIFQVHDRFVHSVLQEYNAAVYEDACVEFFFSPDLKVPDRYFHIETNTSGHPFFAYDTVRREDILFKIDELKQIEIACSLPPKVDPEISGPVTWTLEYRIPLTLLRKYAKIAQPAPGVLWNANFCKTASKTSNPHWITWAPVNMPGANFHQPDFFGTLKFK